MKVEKKCKIVKKSMLTPLAVEFVLEVGDMLRSCGGVGEFVHIRCSEGDLLRRPISVCSGRMGSGGEPDVISIVFEARGKGTAWLLQREEGEFLDILGLLGRSFDVTKKGRYLLVGGGIGVPPMLWAGGHCCFSEEMKPTAILGFRSKDREMLLSEFGEVCEEVLVATDDGTSGYHGFVDAVLREKLSKDSDFVGVLACGPLLMLKNTVKVAKEFNIPCQVSMEERMGCGVGACLVCACDKADGTRAHVCKDGPVFWADEMDWGE